MKNKFIVIIYFILITALPAMSMDLPRLNETFRITTHNSYWIKRSSAVEAFSTGAQENLLDQLLFENVRGLEIDIHRDWKKKGSWRVYHTDREKNSICNPFDECLRQLRQFHYLVPKHEAVIVVLELKQLFSKNFSKGYLPSDLDAILERELGPHLYRPRDFMQDCPGSTNLRECARERKHPLIKDLRGKFIFTVLGNWRWCHIGNGAGGWADYATHENNILKRSAFPHETDRGDFSRSRCGNEHIPKEKLELARANSLFLQVENLDDPEHLKEVAQLMREGVMVRAKDAFTREEQEHRLSLGFHIIQTDYPWIQVHDFGQRIPLRPFGSHDPRQLHDFYEPGSKLLFKKMYDEKGMIKNESSYAIMRLRDDQLQGPFYIESMPSTTRPSPDPKFWNMGRTRGKGCLYAGENRSPMQGGDFIELCRQTSEDGMEETIISIEGRLSGQKFYKSHKSNFDILKMTVFKQKLQFYSLAQVFVSGETDWKVLHEFNMNYKYVGLSSHYGDVMFVGNKTPYGHVNGMELDLEEEAGHRLLDHSWQEPARAN